MKYCHINLWDTSLVTDMTDLFQAKASFNDDISLWIVWPSWIWGTCLKFQPASR
jgi:hypothetical protein